MRRFLKILAVVFTSIIIFILLLSISIKLFEDDIAKAALKQVSKSIDAPVEIGSVNFNLIRGFPKSTIEFRDLWLTSPKENCTDTIAGIHHLYVSMNSRAAMKGRYEVERIEIDGLALNYNIDPDSLTNIDFLMSLIPSDSSAQDITTDSSIEANPDSTTLYFNLQQLLLKNISCSYFDGTSNTGAKIQIPEIIMKGNIMGDDYTAKTNGNITITNVNFGDYNLELMQKASLDFNIQYIEDSIQINDFSFQSDGINISATGNANIGNDIKVNASIKEGRIDLGILSKYIPREMMKEMGLISAQGLLAFNTNITGTYNDSTMPRVDADFSFENGAIKTTDYPEIKYFSLAGKASNGTLRNNTTTSLDLSSLKIATQNSSIRLKAHILNIDQPIYSFETSGAVLIDEFTDYIPEGSVKSISGHIKWQMGSSGEMPKEIDDNFTDYILARSWANISVQHLSTVVDSSLTIENFSTDFAYKPEHFSIQNLTIGLPSYDIILENSSADITLKGSLTDVDNMACTINDSHLEFDNNSLDLRASVSNLTNPDYAFDADITLNLADLQKLVPDTLVTAMSGIINGHIISQGTVDLDSIETQGTALAFENSRLALTFDDVCIAMTDTLIDLTNMNLGMEMKPDTISIDHFSVNYKGLDLAMNATKVINAYNTAVLNKAEQLTIITSVAIGDVDYAFLEPFMLPADSTTEETSLEDTTESITNYTMDIKGDITINSFSMANYEVDSTMTIKHLDLDNISCKFRVSDSTYIADSLSFDAFGGHMLTSVRYDMSPNDIANIALRNHIDGMDFEQLLYDMDNFGQNDLTSENISGKLLSETNVEMTMIGDSIPMDQIRMKGTFTLTDGGVYNFEPAKELSKFTGIKELGHIEFQTLNTQLFVHKGAAYMPKTDIISSAVDITAFGMQTFGEDYEYHLELHLGDVLTGKSKNLMKRQEKAAKEADDEVNRNGVNLVIYSLDGKTKNGFDNKKEMRKMSNRITSKNGVLSMFFHPQLVDFDTQK